MGGLDALVFIGGVGEHRPWIRDQSRRRLEWLDVGIDALLNAQNTGRIDATGSAARILVIPTDEEQVVADEGLGVLQTAGAGSVSWDGDDDSTGRHRISPFRPRP